MCVSCNDCPPQVNRLKTWRKLLGQRNVIPEYDKVDDSDGDSDGDDVEVVVIMVMLISVIVMLIMITFSTQQDAMLMLMMLIMMITAIVMLIMIDHLLNTTRCMAVRNSSRDRQPSLGTEII